MALLAIVRAIFRPGDAFGMSFRGEPRVPAARSFRIKGVFL
jgi:hypothetical protein